MANTIRIKRSSSTDVPTPTLAQGELANSEAGSPNSTNELWVGTAGATQLKIIRNNNGLPAQPTTGLPNAVLAGTDYLPFEDTDDSSLPKRELVSDIPLSAFDDTGYANQVITTGLGIDGADAGDATAITISLATTELANTLPVAADQFVFNDATDELPKKYAASTIPLSLFLNDTPFLTAEVDTLASVTGRAATTAVESTFSGGLLLSDSDINRPVLEDYGVKHTAPTVSTNAVTLDCAVSNSFLVDMDPATATTTVTLSNPSPSGTYCEMTIAIVMGTPAYGITWPGSVTWQGGSAPTLTTTDNDVDLVHLFTVDAGTNWYGTFALADAASGGGTVTAVTGGNGIDSTGGTTPVISLNVSELTAVAAVTADYMIIEDVGDNSSKKALLSTTEVGLFANVTTEYVSENDTLVVVDWQWVLDQDTMSSNSATHLPTQQSVKAYVDTEVAAAVASEMTYKGGYNAATDTPALDTGSPTLAVGDMYVVTTGGTFFALPVVAGDTLIANTASTDAASFADWDIVEGLQTVPDATESEKGIIEIATQAEVDTLTGGSALLVVTPAYMHLTTFDGGTF